MFDELFSKMFSNISGKIKTLAKVVFVAGVAAALIQAITLWATGYSQVYLTGLLALAVGCLGAWAVSLLIYGFGELISRSAGIDEKVEEIDVNLAVAAEKDSDGGEENGTAPKDGNDNWTCPKCYAENPRIRVDCAKCGTPRP